ncbi:dihydropyrimidinase [Candidatus Bipolaricaulota bacterium]|nr:dihydropyrimidinase [Candidatus Bipolaricaulota bacterium]
MKLNYLIKNGSIVSNGRIFEGDVGVVNDKIALIGNSVELEADHVYDAAGCYVTPGFIDSHTHMQLPVSGTVSSDDFFSGGRAAAWGGVTTIIDFTTPGPGQGLVSGIMARKEEARLCPIDYSLHGTFYGYDGVEPEDLQEAIEMGVTSFKFFTAYGESNRRTPDGELFQALKEIGGLGGLAMVHCENDEIIAKKREDLISKEKKSIEHHPASRPDYSESTAVGKVVHLAKVAGSCLHLAHLTTKESINLLKRGKELGIDLSGETCPQYLLLTEDCYEEKNGHRYAATPPLRLDEDREVLWNALESGVLDSVATDHCPFRNEQKDEFQDNFLDIPQGLPGVETLPSLLFTEGVKENHLSIERMVELIAEKPARRFGLYPEKGSLTVGTDADIVVFDPEDSRRINPDKLHMNTDFNPFAGKRTCGWPRYVFLRGKPVLQDNKFGGKKGQGEWVNRNRKNQSGGNHGGRN